MPGFFTKPVKDLHVCKSRPELYAYLFWRLSQRSKQLSKEQKVALEPCLARIQTWIVNHVCLSDEAIVEFLLSAKAGLGDQLYEELLATVKISCKTALTLKQRWENPFYRHFESQWAVAFLAKPTPAVMDSVRLISERIIAILKVNRDHPLIAVFLEKISLLSKEQEAFGKLDSASVSIEAVLALLENNQAKDFHHLLLIHYSFARHLYRDLDQLAGKTFTPILLQGVYQDFIQGHEEKLSNPSKELRKAFIDGFLRGATCFSDWRQTRGRGSFSEGVDSNQMGLMLQKHNAADLPQLALPQKWSPDALCQEPAFDSAYVQEVLNKDLVYVAGPSGMSTLLLGLSELFAVHPTVKSKENYAFATSVFLVSGGLHAWHEVLAVAHDLLEYFPSYQCGEYEAIFKHFEQERDFKENLGLVWSHFYDYCDKQFRYAALHRDLKARHREYFESRFALALCVEAKSLTPVQGLSLVLKELISANAKELCELIAKKPEIKKELYHPYYFGSVKAKGEDPQAILDDLILRLGDDNTELTEQIHLHSVFARHLFNYLEQHKKLNKRLAPIGSDRGRTVIEEKVSPSERLGICRLPFFNQKLRSSKVKHLSGIDEFGPDLHSAFYLAMAGQSQLFISGASGHTVKLLSQAKQMLNINESELKEYALACFAYLTAGGNHSYYEVLQTGREQGLSLRADSYAESLPAAFRVSTSFQALVSEFPEYLAESRLKISS